MARALVLLVYAALGLISVLVTLGMVTTITHSSMDTVDTVDLISVGLLYVVNPVLLVIASVILIRRQWRAFQVLPIPLVSFIGLGVMLQFSIGLHSYTFLSWLFGLVFIALFFVSIKQ